MSGRFYDLIMTPTERSCLRDWRAELVGRAAGRVLEIGAGTGLNLEHYTEAVEHLTIVEPDAQMRSRLAPRLASCRAREVTVEAKLIEELDAPHQSFDAIVCTLVMCSVPEPLATLEKLALLLKPEAPLIFIEHVGAPARSMQRRLQHVVEPAWLFCSGGCHLTRDTEETLQRAGFHLDEVIHEPLCWAPAFVSPSIRGVAHRAAE